MEEEVMADETREQLQTRRADLIAKKHNLELQSGQGNSTTAKVMELQEQIDEIDAKLAKLGIPEIKVYDATATNTEGDLITPKAAEGTEHDSGFLGGGKNASLDTRVKNTPSLGNATYLHGEKPDGSSWNKTSPMDETERLSRLADRLNNRIYYRTATADRDAGHYRMDPIETEDMRQQKQNRELREFTNRRERENQSETDKLYRQTIEQSRTLWLQNQAMLDQLKNQLSYLAESNDENARNAYNNLVNKNYIDDEALGIIQKYANYATSAAVYQNVQAQAATTHYAAMLQNRVTAPSWLTQGAYTNWLAIDNFNNLERTRKRFEEMQIPEEKFNELHRKMVYKENLSYAERQMLSSLMKDPTIYNSFASNLESAAFEFLLKQLDLSTEGRRR
jgi:hypothetical protein